jgi:glycosyltransferase involved in cell wall biosynthesis
MSKYLFSIVTSCYRGVSTLKRTFDSLQSQCSNDISFEWILIDDYSNDNNQTISLINELCEKASFPTKKVFLEKNYYASRSTFTGATIAEGEYIVILDQDDMLVDNGLRIFKTLIDKYSNEENIVGVCGRCIDMNSQLIGSKTKWEEIISNELEIRHIYKVRGEMFQCTKREVILEYFCDFLPGYVNGYAWMRIARKFQYVYTNKIVRIYDTSNPLSHSNSKKIKFINAQIEMLKYILINNYDYLKYDKSMLLRRILQYSRLSFHSKASVQEIISLLPIKQRYLILAIIPFGFFRYLVDRMLSRV